MKRVQVTFVGKICDRDNKNPLYAEFLHGLAPQKACKPKVQSNRLHAPTNPDQWQFVQQTNFNERGLD